MRKKNAFTLIELLAVILVLAIVSIVATPIIVEMISKSKQATFERSLDGILEAVRLDYAIEGFDDSREYFYDYGELTLLKVGEETQNKKVNMKGKLNGNGFIYADREGIRLENVCDKTYCASGKENNIIVGTNEDGKVPEYTIADPTIRLNGEEIIYVGLKETYEELGAIAKTIGGQKLEYVREIRLNDEIVSQIDSSTENTYIVTYKTENASKEAVVTRTVIVLNMKPAITMTEGSTSYVKEQEILITTSAVKPNNITSFTVEIKKNREVISTETVTGISKMFTLSETGEYEVKVTVTDNNNHISTETKNYKIDSEPPVITFTREVFLKENEVAGFNFKEDETVTVTDNSNLVTWEVEGDLNSIKGDQTITYIARDEAGNETRKTRTFHIDEADGPVLNADRMGSNGEWIQAIPVTLSAEIRGENDELTSFSYQVDNGTEVNVPIDNNKLMRVEVTLNITGKHKITIKAVGKYGNETSIETGEYWIDVTSPTVGAISGNSDTWSANKTLTSVLADSNSGVKYYALIKNNATKPSSSSTEWKTVSTTNSYNFSGVVTSNGTYYLWAKDAVGNISVSSMSVVISKIDETIPTLTITSNYSGKYGDSRTLTRLYTATYGTMGGSTTCKSGNTIITDINEINTAGTNSVKCTALGKNGKSTEKTITVTLASETFTELMSVKTFEEVMRASNQTTSGVNLRYVGSNPNNYVDFNDELWRIVGIFNGQVKLVRSESIGTRVMNSANLNIWEQSAIQEELNGSYWNSMNKTSRSYVDQNHLWNVGGYSTPYGKRQQFYDAERGTDVYSGHPTTWRGKVGLLYPSDYGFSTSSTASECDSVGLYSWTTSGNVAACRANSWLSTGSYWTMTPNSANSKFTFIVYNNSEFGLGWDNAVYALGVRPVVYLNTNVRIKRGTGTSSDPYRLTVANIANNDPGKNYRYVGSNPNNYVRFNNELWRIIGVFGGQTKIVRLSALNNKLNAWSTDNINNWTNSTLQKELNGTYLNSIEATSKNYIEQHIWQLGGWNTAQITRKDMYNYERGNTVYTEHKATWTGKVGLIYPSDYTYASNGGSVCDTITLNVWNNSSAHSECAKKSWLFQVDTNYMTMTPYSHNPGYVYYIHSYTDSTYNAVGGVVGAQPTNHAGVAYPAVYLKSTVKITGGAGTSSNPYLLGT